MADKIETFRLKGVHNDFFTSIFRRRAILQSLAALTLVPALPKLTLASENSGDVVARKSRRLHIDRPFVLFPINNEALSRRVRLVKDGHVLRSFTASLGLPAQWWAHLDVSAWQGQTPTLSVEPDTNTPPTWQMKTSGRGARETDNAELASAIHTSAKIWQSETLYKEPLRPLFHFSPRRGWNNDPNGLMYHNGQYHLFFQHNPYGLRWGNAHWGHAVSRDLVHWKELPIALYPHGDGDFPYSGSGVVDHENISGWGKDGRPPMVIAFTSTGRGECIAYSNDDGVTWKEFEGNPVIQHNGRDPRLLWHPQTKQWVMAVYSETGAEPAAPDRQGIAFYTSADLRSWQQRSWIEGYIDCPDLFALPVDGDPKRMKWVLTCGIGHYCVGEFDGSRFLPQSPKLPLCAGGGALSAAQTFSNDPEGRVVQIAWAHVDTVDSPFTQMMSFPTTLSLRTTSEGVRLCHQPVEAIRSLRIHTYEIPSGPLTPVPMLTGQKGEAWDIELDIRVGTTEPITMSIGGDEYQYQPASQMLSGPKGTMPIPLTGGRLQLRVLVDRTTVEIFGDRGQAHGLFIRGNPGESAVLALHASQGHIERLSAHLLRKAWEE